MNIAMISPYSWDFPGGVNRHIEQLSDHLRGRGHRVTIVAPDGGESAEFHSAGRSFSISFNQSVAHLSFGPRVAARLKHFLEEKSFDLLHLHEPLIPSTTLLALHYSRSANLATFHAAREGGSLAYSVGRPLLGPLARKLHVRVAVSPAALQLISRYFPGESQIIPNGVDTRIYSPQGDILPGLESGLFYLLFVGRHEPRKGLKILLEAFPKLRATHPEVRLLVVGVQNPIGRIEGVLWLGRLRDDQMPLAYRSAHVLVSPALGWESFGVVLIEAMASGVPVVASDIPGYRAVVDDAVQGFLVPSGDPDALARVLGGLVANREILYGMSEAALKKSQEYSWERLVIKVEAAYQEALARQGRVA